MEDSTLLEDILTLDDTENHDNVEVEPTLVDVYQDLILMTESLKSGVEKLLEKEGPIDEEEEGDEDDDDEDDEDDEEDDKDNSEDEDDDSDKSGDEEIKEKKSDKKKKKVRVLTEMEQFLQALELHKQQKQHLIIKKTILTKIEEVLFGNNNITMTLDLRNMGDDEKDGKLEEILQCKDLSNYMPRKLSENGNEFGFAEKAALRDQVSVAECPPDILKPFRKKTPKKIAVNLIKNQYNLRWNTKSGEYKPFDFYDLPKHFKKGIVRKAYVQTLLFEHKNKLMNLSKILNTTELSKEDMSPPFVYVKKDPYSTELRPRNEPKFEWQRWTVHANESQNIGTDFPSELKWINPKVKTLLKKLCNPISDDYNLESTENVMYLFVVNETTSERLSETGNCSQIYIGPADNGLKKRLLDDEDSHCARMMDIYRHFCDTETFTPHDKGLLLELRLLLALVRKEDHALFVLKCCEDGRSLGKETHELIIQVLCLADDEIWGPAVNMNFGLNVKEELKNRRKFLPKSFPGSRKRKR